MKVEKLIDVVQIKNPKPEKFSGEKRYYSTGNIDEHNVSENFELVKFENRPSRANVQPIENSVGFAKMKSTAKTLLVTKNYSECIFSTGMNFLLPSEHIISKYLYYYLISPYFLDLKDKYSGQGIMGGLSNKDLNLFKIPVPSLQEQEKIVERLSVFDQDINKLKITRLKKIDAYRKLLKSFSYIFPDKNIKTLQIDDITFEYGRGKSKHRPRNFKGLYGGKYPFIQTSDVRNSNVYINEYQQTYNEMGLKQSKLWPAGTICLNIAANVGDVAILNFDACFPDSILGIKANTEIVYDKYLYYLLFNKFDEINKLSENSAAQKNFNLRKLQSLIFNIPSLEVQKDIVDRLDSAFLKIEKLLEVLAKQELKINMLSNSVLNKEFSYE